MTLESILSQLTMTDRIMLLSWYSKRVVQGEKCPAVYLASAAGISTVRAVKDFYAKCRKLGIFEAAEHLSYRAEHHALTERGSQLVAYLHRRWEI